MQHLGPGPAYINERQKLGTSLKLLNGHIWVIASMEITPIAAAIR
jgi:hypothetical protein